MIKMSFFQNLMRRQQFMVPAGYGYQPAIRGAGMMMSAQGWGVMPQQRVVKSTAATRQSAQRIRKKI